MRVNFRQQGNIGYQLTTPAYTQKTLMPKQIFVGKILVVPAAPGISKPYTSDQTDA